MDALTLREFLTLESGDGSGDGIKSVCGMAVHIIDGGAIIRKLAERYNVGL